MTFFFPNSISRLYHWSFQKRKVVHDLFKMTKYEIMQKLLHSSYCGLGFDRRFFLKKQCLRCKKKPVLSGLTSPNFGTAATSNDLCRASFPSQFSAAEKLTEALLAGCCVTISRSFFMYIHFCFGSSCWHGRWCWG